MRGHLIAVTMMAVATLPSAAHAINCAHATSPIEHTICGSQAILHADTAMNRAYIAILKAAPDPEIHAMLVASQKRWISARDKTFGDLDKATDGQTGEVLSKVVQAKLIMDAIKDRTGVLTQKSKDASMQPVLIQMALRQQRFVAQFTGGPFAGYDTSCEFFPDDSSGNSREYQCYATHHVQNDNRVCSQGLDWATYRTYSSGSVADVIEGKPKLVATCADDDCGDDDTGAGANWNLHPEATSGTAFPQSLPQLDAEAMDSMSDDQPSWLKACLMDPHFPHSESSK
ncbi:lysozyme inhibitor LprI family protein [Acidisoma silvae]|uniref:DUF1311 domain-containing protein n=1 Tax=Acidisoma silvae TaxID=2802396 RepID=A0A964E194_9PROT|nr:lysozyme inhibitor LprI family protein [Acidisoma silvae]MCB8877982.1 DUF1311 domain-containing protein [Acidisoma silvae]